MIRNHKVKISLGPGVELNTKELEEIELIRLEMERDLNQKLTWVDAIRAVDEKCDPAPLLALLDIPPKVAPYVKDLFDRKLGPGLKKRGPKIPLAQKNAKAIEHAASAVRVQIKTGDLTVANAVDRVREENPWIAKKFKRNTLIAHLTGKSGHGRRERKRRRS
jgi:hypothetical protein